MKSEVGFRKMVKHPLGGGKGKEKTLTSQNSLILDPSVEIAIGLSSRLQVSDSGTTVTSREC